LLIGQSSSGVFLVPRLIVESRGSRRSFPSLLERNILTPLERFVPLGPSASTGQRRARVEAGVFFA